MLIKAAYCQGLLEKELAPLNEYAFSLFVDNRPTAEELAINPVNIYATWEPNEYTGNVHWIAGNQMSFDAILTWNKDLLQYVPNTVKMLFGTSAFHDKILYPDGDNLTPYRKEKKITFIRGNKHFNVKGHHIRWELWNRQEEIKETLLYKSFYATTTPEYASTPEEDRQWFMQRRNIFESPMFHIAVENTSQDNYFTEKIMDAFLFETVPIYFGCPNIGDYFNKSGIITFNSTDELIDICNKLTIQDFYERQFAVWDNNKRCQKYLNLGATVRNTLKSIFDAK